MARPKKPGSKIDVESLRHKDKRANIPTEELRGFAAEDEAHPRSMRYPRDPTLDPQLVWKGKDEQDREDLEVPVVPIYIQEKIHPQAIIEEVRSRGALAEPTSQLDLFSDFNGIDTFEKKVDFYHWPMHWSNRMVLGDSLLAMTSLAEKEGLKGKVQMIYIDPPYGIKFGSNWQVSTRKRDVKDGGIADMAREPEVVKAFRDTWELGIHSYLTYLRDRFVAARELLTETGSIFVQIGDENVHLVRNVLDEVFGSENFVSLITFRKKNMPLGSDLLEGTVDYLLWYAREKSAVKYRGLFNTKSTEGDSHWDRLQEPDGLRRKLSSKEINDHSMVPKGGEIYELQSLYPAGMNASGLFPFAFQGQTYVAPPRRSWKTNEIGLRRVATANRVEPYSDGITLRYVQKLDDYSINPYSNLWADLGAASDAIFVVQTNPTVIQRCLLMTTDPGDLVLDPTCGSGTTAYVAEQWGRRWITMDTSRVALALARTRLMSARFPYYLLSDSPDGAAKERELSAIAEMTAQQIYADDVRKGFVYRRVPHITLGSIANNEEIDEIHARYQQQLEPLRARLNTLTKQSWEEWQVPRDADKAWPSPAENVHADWWKLRRERQAEIDASIARRADTEVLVDQPYEDNKRVRVTGPFTVESLSPHRLLAEDDRPATETAARQDAAATDFVTTILDNLRKAGVQNARSKDDRLKFDRLEPYADAWLQAAGTFTDKSGKERRVAVSIGGEHSTVGSDQVREAAKAAMRGAAAFDLLVVCGFAFDAHAGSTAREISPEPPEKPDASIIAEEQLQFGKLPVLLARMNPDLAMGDELLKKTGAGNLFMVFGEPDIRIDRDGDGKIIVEIHGLDVYDPTTGQIRSSSTDDIACWFIDTAYNDESFFVRHAYFTGADEPYEKLKRALRAEIDEAAWSALYSTKSYPFDPPASGKIAVKVINHYGDEVLKVYGV
jgi:adenine-specific DNA-methyltransferase